MDIRGGVDRAAIFIHFKMHMGACGASRTTHFRYHFAFFDDDAELGHISLLWA